MRHTLIGAAFGALLYVCYRIDVYRWEDCSFSEGVWEMGYSGWLCALALLLGIGFAWARLGQRRKRLAIVLVLALLLQGCAMWYLVWGTKKVAMLLEKEEACVCVIQLPESRWSLYIDVGFMYVAWVCTTVLIFVFVRCTKAVLMFFYLPQQIDALIANDVLRANREDEGLSQEAIDRIPEVEGKEADICSICLETYTPGVMIKQLPTCKHMFHKNCIALWLQRSTICPFCKQRVPEAPAQPIDPIAEAD